MNKDIKRFFIDEEVIGKEHECNCNGECGGDCKCHQEEEAKIDVNDIVSNSGLLFTSVESADPNTLQAEIKYLEGARELTKISKGDLIDLYAYEDVFVPYMGQTLISLGFSLKLPKGYMAKLYPRSSTFKTWGLIQTNHTGIIDESYCGNDDIWHLPVQCTMPKQVEKVKINGHKVTVAGTWVKKDDKIAQFEIVDAMEMPTFKKVEDLGNYNRGGFGSTGEK